MDLFSREDATEVARRHAIALSPVPVDWHAARCDCQLGDDNHDVKAHWTRHCWKAAVYVKACEWAGIPLKIKELQ